MTEEPEAVVGKANPENMSSLLPGQRFLKLLPSIILFLKGIFYYSYSVPIIPLNSVCLCWATRDNLFVNSWIT